MGITERIRQLFQRARGSMETHQTALTFAESNATEYVDALYGNNEAGNVQEAGPAKLLVVGEESGFQEEIMEYALDMAKRMSYEIVALNAAPLECNAFKNHPDSYDQVCREFQAAAERTAESFRNKAQSLGINFSHVVKFNEPELAVQETIKEYGTIDFVVSNRPEHSENRIENDNRPRQEIYVYTMTT